MTDLTSKNNPGKSVAFSTIAAAGLLSGTLDICSAFLYSYIKKSTMPQTVLQNISKVAFGKERFGEVWMQNITGLLMHYVIAFGWTILFFLLYPRMKWMSRNRILTGIVYGLFVWTMMNVVLLPLWNYKPFVFNPEVSTINAVILILAIGMPLSFIAGKKR